MSSRWYPIFQKGNPQLRVFLPNFWMKLAKFEHNDAPPNRLKFIVHEGMSRLDVRNYLEKIYNVPVVGVRIMVAPGKTRQVPRKQYVVKDDDCKVAFVTVPKDYNFQWPDLFPAEKKNKELQSEQKHLEELAQQRQKFLERNKAKLGVPGWFS